MMKIIDGIVMLLRNCYMNPKLDFNKRSNQELDVSYPRLKQAGVKVQCFAIYLSESIQQPTF